jgi:hypothetical protein
MVTPEATYDNPMVMTRVDLRKYAAQLSGLSGKFYVGFVVPEGKVHILISNPGDYPGTSFSRANGEWGLFTNDTGEADFHIRAIMGEETAINGNDNIAENLDLMQNYPNPFNPSTTINFNLVKSGNVSLVVYDVAGRKVADLLNSKISSGSHSVKFNGSTLSTGVYYYTLKADGVSVTKKMMLLK